MEKIIDPAQLQRDALKTRLLDLHQVLDEIYGTGWSAHNPQAVAIFFQARAVEQMAGELQKLHSTLAEGTGALTVGLEGTHAAG